MKDNSCIAVPAEITRFQGTVYANEGESASIICGVNGNPVVDNMASWSRPGFDMSKTNQVYSNSERLSQITVHDLLRTDSGKFICTADNKVSPPKRREASLVVRCKYLKARPRGQPNFDLSLTFSKCISFVIIGLRLKLSSFMVF